MRGWRVLRPDDHLDVVDFAMGYDATHAIFAVQAMLPRKITIVYSIHLNVRYTLSIGKVPHRLHSWSSF